MPCYSSCTFADDVLRMPAAAAPFEAALEGSTHPHNYTDGLPTSQTMVFAQWPTVSNSTVGGKSCGPRVMDVGACIYMYREPRLGRPRLEGQGETATVPSMAGVSRPLKCPFGAGKSRRRTRVRARGMHEGTKKGSDLVKWPHHGRRGSLGTPVDDRRVTTAGPMTRRASISCREATRACTSISTSMSIVQPPNACICVRGPCDTLLAQL